MSISTLPIDVLNYTYSFLESKDLIQARSTSTLWNDQCTLFLKTDFKKVISKAFEELSSNSAQGIVLEKTERLQEVERAKTFLVILKVWEDFQQKLEQEGKRQMLSDFIQEISNKPGSGNVYVFNIGAGDNRGLVCTKTDILGAERLNFAERLEVVLFSQSPQQI